MVRWPVAHVLLRCLLLLAFVCCCWVFPYSTAAGGRQLSLSHIHCTEHMCDATQLTWLGLLGWGWGGVGCDRSVGLGGGGAKFLHIERKITSVVHSHPPSHYIRKHAPG